MRFGQSEPLPPICKNLLFINIGVFVMTLVLNQRLSSEIINLLGLHYLDSPNFRPFQLFSYQFIHSGPMHLIFNMFGLYIFGSRLEYIWGAQKFLFFYLFCVAGSALFMFIVNGIIVYKATGFLMPHGKVVIESYQVLQIYNSVTIGASGAIVALLAAFARLFPNTEMYIMLIPIPVKAKYLAIGYGIIELYLGIANRDSDNVAHFGHVGGLLFGLLLVWYWNKTNRNTFY